MKPLSNTNFQNRDKIYKDFYARKCRRELVSWSILLVCMLQLKHTSLFLHLKYQLHDSQKKDTKHNDTKRKGTQNDILYNSHDHEIKHNSTQYNDTHYNDAQYNDTQ